MRCRIATERSRAAVQALRKVDDGTVRRSGAVQAGLTTSLDQASITEVKSYLRRRHVPFDDTTALPDLRACAAYEACRHKGLADSAWHERYWQRKMGVVEPPLKAGLHEQYGFPSFWHGWRGFYAELGAGPAGLCGQRFLTGWFAFAYFHAVATYYAFRFLYRGQHLEDLKDAVYSECAMEVIDSALAVIGILVPGLRNIAETPRCLMGFLVAHHVLSCVLLPLAVYIGFPPEKLAWFLLALDGSGTLGCLFQVAWCTPLRSTVLNWAGMVVYQVINFWFRGPWFAMAAWEATAWICNNHNSAVAGLMGFCFAPFFLVLLLGHEINCVAITVGWISKKRRCVIADWDGTSDKTEYLEKRATEVTKGQAAKAA